MWWSCDCLLQLLYCRGELVNILTRSNCSRYVEFRAVNKIYTQMNGKIEQVRKVPAVSSSCMHTTTCSHTHAHTHTHTCTHTCTHIPRFLVQGQMSLVVNLFRCWRNARWWSFSLSARNLKGTQKNMKVGEPCMYSHVTWPWWSCDLTMVIMWLDHGDHVTGPWWSCDWTMVIMWLDHGDHVTTAVFACSMWWLHYVTTIAVIPV